MIGMTRGFGKFERKNKSTEKKASAPEADEQTAAESKDAAKDQVDAKPTEGEGKSDKKIYQNLQEMMSDIEKEFQEAERKRKEKQQKSSDGFKKPQHTKDAEGNAAGQPEEKPNKKFTTLAEMREEIEKQMKRDMEKNKKAEDGSKEQPQDTGFWKNKENQKNKENKEKQKVPDPEPESPWRKYFEIAHKYLDKKYPYLIAVIIGLAGYVWLIDSERNIHTVTEEVGSGHRRSSSKTTWPTGGSSGS